METFGASVVASPSDKTNSGRAILEANPDSTGSLGIAISEAVEDAATHDDTNYALGSVLGHVLLHQTVIGLEAQQQMEMAGEQPDVVVGCVGGGSNYAGISYPFMAGKLRGETPDMRFLATEPAACPTLTKGRFAYDYGDTAQISPIVPMYTLGHDFVPAPVHAGGLRYHGDSPSLSLLVKHGHMDAVAYTQNETFEAGLLFAKTQGILPAPEANHAVKGAIDEAIAAREAGEEPRDPVQPLRARALRHAGLRRLPGGQASRPRVRRRRRGSRAREPSRGADPGLIARRRRLTRRGCAGLSRNASTMASATASASSS